MASSHERLVDLGNQVSLYGLCNLWFPSSKRAGTSLSKHGAVHLDSDPGLQIAPFQTRRGRRLAHRASAAEERKRRRQPSHTSRSLVSSRQAEARRQAFQAESRSHGAKEPAKATARRFARSLPRPSSPDQRHRDRSPHDREFGRHGCGLAVWQPQNRGCPHGQPGNGRRDAQVQRPYAASSYKAHIRVPAHLAFSLVGLSVPGASRQSSRSGRKQPARSFPARERPPPARPLRASSRTTPVMSNIAAPSAWGSTKPASTRT